MDDLEEEKLQIKCLLYIFIERNLCKVINGLIKTTGENCILPTFSCENLFPSLERET